jgi:hypothetical protein
MKWISQILSAGCLLLWPTLSAAQVVDLADPIGRQVVTGSVAGGRAGTWLDVGDVNGDISNRDLIVGSPDAAAGRGEVRILYGWVSRTGSFTLNEFNVVLTGAAAGDRFGTSTNAGFVLTAETRPTPTTSRDLVVGAPGALGGRGEVYLFAGPVEGPSLDTSNAVSRMMGAPGDQLGIALETADLNNDGFREIVIGAPGNGRVYVIDHHNFPAATRDLTLPQPGVLIIEGTGIGYVLAAGDITGDGIFDLAIGAPTASFSAGAVYVINGRATALPTSLSLPSGANSTFAGLTVGDNAGSALWIRDVDGDGTWDLVITALDADGPGDTRIAAGEAYVVFGGPALPAALTPQSTIYGAAAGHRLGHRLWVGSITRDEPDDIALLASGANSGFGEAYLVYGRSRASFPAFIDLATSADRRIISDETQGPIDRLVVFEVTGEGAEDLVLSVPGADAGAGRLYFSISPTLTSEAQGTAGGHITVNLVVNPGQVVSTPIRLKNRTNIPVGWEVATNRSYLSVSPAEGSSTFSQDGVFNLFVSSEGLASGFYQGQALVVTTSNLDTSLIITVNVRVAAPSREPGDFSGDGGYDLVWQHQTTGKLALWEMHGTTLFAGDAFNPAEVADINWKVAATGDFDGDGHPDLLWHHQTDGSLALWTMNGRNMVRGFSLSPDRVADTDWKIVATADFDGDGKRDILWRHQTQGLIAAWLMDGITMKSGTLLSPGTVADANWTIGGAGDFNGDGRSDLVWHNVSTGELAVWLMNGTTQVRGFALTPGQVADTAWRIRAIADINRDGHPDLVWQHTGSGAIAAWFMNGTTQISGTLLTPSSVADLNWKIVGPR